MLSAQQLKNYKWVGKSIDEPLENYMKYAQELGMNYVFMDKTDRNITVAESLRSLGYTVVIGYGEVSRIKISW